MLMLKRIAHGILALILLAGCKSNTARHDSAVIAPAPPAASVRAASPVADSLNKDTPDTADAYAARRPVFRPPSALTQLPREVRDTLAGRGCTILQTRGGLNDSVLRGAFFGDGENDWAVLCVIGDRGSILVFQRGVGVPTTLPAIGIDIPDAAMLDHANLCTGGILSIAAARLKAVVARGVINDESDSIRLTGAERKRSVHDGIGSSDCEGVHNIYYWTGSRWVMFPGDD